MVVKFIFYKKINLKVINYIDNYIHNSPRKASIETSLSSLVYCKCFSRNKLC